MAAVLLVALLACWSGARAGPSTEQPSQPPGLLTCYTCVNVSDNDVCNQFAIDRPCPQDKTFCLTLHAMGHVGESWLVNKKCADRSECNRAAVGCSRTDGQTVCVSCCDESYCNEPVPRNNATARLTSSSRNEGEAAPRSSGLMALLALLPLLHWPGVT